MPIKPENKDLYPADWPEIRARILRRANNRCEGSPAFPDCRVKNGEIHPLTGSLVVLTVAHLDHNPENCKEKNLRAWCQRCHLTYDAKVHAEHARATRIMKSPEHKTNVINEALEYLFHLNRYGQLDFFIPLNYKEISL